MTKIIEICFQASSITLPVVASDSPEGFLPGKLTNTFHLLHWVGSIKILRLATGVCQLFILVYKRKLNRNKHFATACAAVVHIVVVVEWGLASEK